MALYDKPQIDSSAINSSISENRLSSLLSESNGFIIRKEIPDKGCDFMCELIEERSVTGYKFPVQLKSIETIKIVNSGTYISYSFLTSRLGYMLNHIPTTGIIILYDVINDKLYYDFADAIYSRAVSERDSNDWIHNDTINIRIPILNIFDQSSIKDFHLQILNRFQQASRMQLANGKKYNLPSINLTQEFQFDFNNIDHLKLLLKKYGLTFLISYDLSIIYKTISSLTFNDITSDTEIAILASICYCEAGRYAESDIVVRKLKVQHELSEMQTRMIEYIDSKNQLLLGNIDNKTYLERLHSFKNVDDSNSTIIDINILRYKLIDLKYGKVDQELVLELDDIFKKIDNCETSETIKQLYKIWNSENESMIISQNQIYQFGILKMKQAIDSVQDPIDIENFIKDHIRFELRFLKRINEIYLIACDDKNSFVQASALSAKVTHYLQKLISFIGQEIPVTNQRESLQQNFKFAFEAYQLFSELDLLKDAHYCLCNAIEIIEVVKDIQDADISKDIMTLNSAKLQLEKELLLPSYKLVMPDLLQKMKSRQLKKENKPTMYSVKKMNDDELNLFAEMVVKSYQIHPYFQNNVLDELKAYRLFYNRCNDENIEVLQNNSSRYQSPVQFVLRNKISNQYTERSSDMELLLSSLGY